MDAQAYLIRQGWSGPGNPLNPNRRPGPHGGLGLTRPLLISRKENKTGVGQKSTKDPTNQWWLRGFEEALRGVGTDGGATPSETIESDSLIRNGSELYKFFVRGEALPGTLDAAKQSGSVASTVVVSTESEVSILTHKMKSKKGKKDKERRNDRKRKREDDDDDDRGVSMSQRKKDKKQKKRKSTESDDAENTEDTDERKATKKSKKSRKSKRNDDVEGDEQHSKQSPIDEQNVSELQRDKDRNKQDKKKDKGPDDKKEKKRRKKSRVLAIEEDYPTPASLSPKEDSIMSVVAVKEKTKKKEKKEKSLKAKKQKRSTNKDSVT